MYLIINNYLIFVLLTKLSARHRYSNRFLYWSNFQILFKTEPEIIGECLYIPQAWYCAWYLAISKECFNKWWMKLWEGNAVSHLYSWGETSRHHGKAGSLFVLTEFLWGGSDSSLNDISQFPCQENVDRRMLIISGPVFGLMKILCLLYSLFPLLLTVLIQMSPVPQGWCALKTERAQVSESLLVGKLLAYCHTIHI